MVGQSVGRLVGNRLNLENVMLSFSSVDMWMKMDNIKSESTNVLNTHPLYPF